MTKQFTVFFAFIFTINVFAQTSFVKGYFINNSNEKINCFIKNEDWLNNPTEFKYKIEQNSEKKTLTINSVKEFGVVNTFKYVRRKVDIDRSSKKVDELDFNVNPIFNNESLFLKVLIEGNATLYYYEEKGFVRYFFNKKAAEVKQLVYKSYLTDGGSAVANNNEFRRQLWIALKCDGVSMNSFKKIDYKKSDLIKFFIKYNKCSNSEFINYQKKKKNEDSFNLNIRPGVRMSSLVLNNPNGSRQFDFGKNLTSFRLGLEAEFILGFNNNKWALLLEPTYHQFSADIETASISQRSLEVNFGLRHYMYLNKKDLKFFVNALIIYDINFGTKLDIQNRIPFSTEVDNTFNTALGIGCKYKERFSLELRYLPTRNTLTNVSEATWFTDVESLSIVLGYSIF
ncbi:tRNA modification GTPase [uncultured Polaribacter sp.]|uniref:tRNA modification GTPase n=1 Tax=uncultured Polaribacter sp. TaxID=174711 RepID=UPI00261B48A7|nr:tRNA modification GTPase [uncultured Polaribacter sp.]